MTQGTALHEFRVAADETRLDQYLAGMDTGMTRSRLRRLIVEGQVLVNGGPAKPSHKVRTGDLVSLSVPPPRPSGLVAQDIPVTVVYQDENLVVIDKPAGLAVHPGPGHPDNTLVNALLAMCPDIQGIGGEIRPGIVHRLDKDTSGLMMVAKTHQAHNDLSAQIKARVVTKGYLALVEGAPSPSNGKVDAPVGRHPRRRTRMAVVVGGKEARTSYKTREKFQGHS
ncbi:MAG: RluA family pseudouridine synthase, partial [Chloroflexi bacterium]|nr:RluA family pseudouridine synthase [Chloroflexota bacterium]